MSIDGNTIPVETSTPHLQDSHCPFHPAGCDNFVRLFKSREMASSDQPRAVVSQQSRESLKMVDADEHSPITSPRQSALDQPSAFLRLPREIVDVIYGYLLTSTTPILWPSERTCSKLTPSILAACKQTHAEAGPVLYGTNDFEFRHPSDITVFRHIMDSRLTCLINRITIHVKARSFERIWRSYIVHKRPQRSLYNDLPQLKALTVVLNGSWWHSRWHPATSLQEWFNHENSFPGLCTTLDGTAVDRVGTDVRVICRQLVPRSHIRILKETGFTDPYRPPVRMLNDRCLELSTEGKYHRDVVLQLWTHETDAMEIS